MLIKLFYWKRIFKKQYQSNQSMGVFIKEDDIDIWKYWIKLSKVSQNFKIYQDSKVWISK